ncbi:hypothetical protein ACS0TY_010290 [Phlomoides rotata]
MTTPARRLIQDQNLNFLYSGTIPGGKTDVAKTDKKGGLGGRKALNDISNSRKPTAFHSVKKEKVGGRKALGDLTNSIKLPTKQLGRKLNAVVEENVSSCKMDERFLHNHQECIKAQIKAVDKDYFLQLVGLSNDIIPQPSAAARSALPFSSKKLQRKSNVKHLEMEEVEDQILPGNCSPACRSPRSPKAPYMSWGDDDFSALMMIESPKA